MACSEEPPERESPLGISRCSVVDRADRNVSLAARGTHRRKSRRHMDSPAGMGPVRWPRARTSSTTRVMPVAVLLPRWMLIQARSTSLPAHRPSSVTVAAMDKSCSSSSTHTRGLRRPQAVKYPAMTDQRQLTGMAQARTRRLEAARTSRIQETAIQSAARWRIIPPTTLAISP